MPGLAAQKSDRLEHFQRISGRPGQWLIHVGYQCVTGHARFAGDLGNFLGQLLCLCWVFHESA